MNWTLNRILPSPIHFIPIPQMIKHYMKQTFNLFQLQEKARCDTKRIMLKNRAAIHEIENVAVYKNMFRWNRDYPAVETIMSF